MSIYDELKGWSGAVEISGTQFADLQSAKESVGDAFADDTCIILYKTTQTARERELTRFHEAVAQYRITVKQYMTQQSNPSFDFMKVWNNDVPMPLRTMIGTIEKETRGMFYMKLHGDIAAPLTQYCMRCGKPITNNVSKYFGLGPVCGNHNYVNPFNDEQQLKDAVAEYRKNYLQKIVWEGWIIKSAILEKEKIDTEEMK